MFSTSLLVIEHSMGSLCAVLVFVFGMFDFQLAEAEYAREFSILGRVCCLFDIDSGFRILDSFLFMLVMTLAFNFWIITSLPDNGEYNIQLGSPIHKDISLRRPSPDKKIRLIRLLILQYRLQHLMKARHLLIILDLLLFLPIGSPHQQHLIDALEKTLLLRHLGRNPIKPVLRVKEILLREMEMVF